MRHDKAIEVRDLLCGKVDLVYRATVKGKCTSIDHHARLSGVYGSKEYTSAPRWVREYVRGYSRALYNLLASSDVRGGRPMLELVCGSEGYGMRWRGRPDRPW